MAPGRRFSQPTVEKLEPRTLLSSALNTDLAVFRTATGRLLLDTNADLVADHRPFLGLPGDQVVAGDLDGNTVTDLAVYRNGLWAFDLNADGVIDHHVHFGAAGHTPLLGDINGDGRADLIVYDRASGVWSVDLTRDGIANSRAVPYFQFGGQSGDIPLVGDIDGNGRDEPVIYRNGTWLVDFNRDGIPDLTFTVAGAPAGTPILTRWAGDYRARPGIFNDGAWHLATTDDRVVNVSFRYGFAGEQPLTGHFSTANSIFVCPGGTGNGSLHQPMGSIQQAVNAHRPGQVIRLAAGTYAENVVAYRKERLTIVGAGSQATHLTPPSGDAIAFILTTDAWMHNLHVAGGGRGIIALGADLKLRYISTAGVRQDGLVSNNNHPEYGTTTLDIAFSAFDRAERGYGIWLQGDTLASIRRTTINHNGTAQDLVPGAANGRGIIISGNSNATIRRSWINHNFDGGLFAIDNAAATIIHTGMSYNIHGNGALFNGNARVSVTNSTFQYNGTVRDPNDLSAGRNGIEFYIDFAGPATVSNSIFRSNTGFGIFVASGTGIAITGNTFDDNFCGIGVEGDTRTTSVTIQGNTLRAAPGSWYETGIYAYGPLATVVIGGAAPHLKNTFRNYAIYRSIVLSYSSITGPYSGFPKTDLAPSDNVFINSPHPIVYD